MAEIPQGTPEDARAEIEALVAGSEKHLGYTPEVSGANIGEGEALITVSFKTSKEVFRIGNNLVIPEELEQDAQ